MKARKGVAPNLKKPGIPKHLKSSSKAPEGGWARRQFEAVERFARSELERAVLAHDARRRVRVVADRTQTGLECRRSDSPAGRGARVAPPVALNSAAEMTSHGSGSCQQGAPPGFGFGERDVRRLSASSAPTEL